MNMKRKLKVGDNIRYTSAFLKCIQATTGWYPQARGYIDGFSGDLARIVWDNPTGVNDPVFVNIFNLQKVR